MRISDWSSDVCSSDLHSAVTNKGKLAGLIYYAANAVGKVTGLAPVDDYARHGKLASKGLALGFEIHSARKTLQFRVEFSGNDLRLHQFVQDRKSTRLNSSH